MCIANTAAQPVTSIIKAKVGAALAAIVTAKPAPTFVKKLLHYVLPALRLW